MKQGRTMKNALGGSASQGEALNGANKRQNGILDLLKPLSSALLSH
jgi:hypothetical protein